MNVRRASRDVQVVHAPARRPAPVVDGRHASILALQQAAGNAAVARALQRSPHALIQRRLPEFAAVEPLLQGDTPEAEIAVKKLRQQIKRTIVAIEREEFGDRRIELAKADFWHDRPDVDWDELLDVDSPLAPDERFLLGEVMDELHFVQRLDSVPAEVAAYPRPGVKIGPPKPGSPQEANLAALVQAAVSTMRAIAGGSHDAGVAAVFGVHANRAKTVYKEAADALARLHGEHNIVIDTRGDQAAVHAAGLTSPKQMALSPSVVGAVSSANQVTLVHESTHAIPVPTADGIYVDIKPGSGFLTASDDFKVTRAPYYEELARSVLGIRALPTFAPPGNSPPPQGHSTDEHVRGAQARVERTAADAWTVAINTHERLVELAREQQGAKPSKDREFNRRVANLSRALGLTIHHRLPGAAQVEINDLDLAIAEDRAAQLSRLLKMATWTTVGSMSFDEAQPVTAKLTGLTDWMGFTTRREEFLAGKILEVLVTARGYSRKSPEKEIAMILALASVYSSGRDAALEKKVPAPLDAFY
jgi:hypothetical protein